MADISNLTVSVELIKGKLYKFLLSKFALRIFAHLPHKLYYWCVIRSMKYKVGNYTNRLNFSLIHGT